MNKDTLFFMNKIWRLLLQENSLFIQNNSIVLWGNECFTINLLSYVKNMQLFRQILLLKNISPQKIDILWHGCQWWNVEVPSTFSQTVGQIEVVEKVVLPEVSNMNDSAINKNQGNQTHFSPEKIHLKKENRFAIVSYICYLVSH